LRYTKGSKKEKMATTHFRTRSYARIPATPGCSGNRHPEKKTCNKQDQKNQCFSQTKRARAAQGVAPGTKSTELGVSYIQRKNSDNSSVRKKHNEIDIPKGELGEPDKKAQNEKPTERTK